MAEIRGSLMFLVWGWCLVGAATAQTVCLPAPRLLTTMPMGGNPGSRVDVTITGENIEDADELSFSDPRITAVRKRDAAGNPVVNQYQVTIAVDCPAGVYEARVMARLGMSSSRAFSVGLLPEVLQTSPNTSLTTALELKMNSLVNAVMTSRSIDHYWFMGVKGQRVVLECLSRGIDSKLEAVLVIASATGNDLKVERRGGVLDFVVPDDGKYVIKVHELTFNGGPAFYYRLALRELPIGAPIDPLPTTRSVNACSWPPTGLPELAAQSEVEPNNESAKAQKISLPCDIAGSFFPAADVDLFEFEAKKGEVWWVEVASERLGLKTDPAVLVQHVSGFGEAEKLTDVAELNDIPSPVKVSSNNYTYDGPPYDIGSADVLGKFVVQEDGVHRLQLRDLYGGTRSDPKNIYRLVIRQAAPEFALAAWGLHMELRNGDRNALSKPLALRGGSTVALEVLAIRRDGYDGDIELEMDGLPEGVTAQGLKIPAGKSRGMMLITAQHGAPRAITSARFVGRGVVEGAPITRRCHLASMAWPVPEAWSEIPSPRLLADVPVSVSGQEFAPLTIAAKDAGVIQATAGEKVAIPLQQTRRTGFSGDKLSMKAMGAGFESLPAFDVSLTSENGGEAVLDLAALKTQPGDYVFSFFGSAVAKYRYNVDAVQVAEAALQSAEQERMALEAAATKLAEQVQAATVEQKSEVERAIAENTVRHKTALAAVMMATERLKKANEVASPKDVVDIVVSEPIRIHVQPAEKK